MYLFVLYMFAQHPHDKCISKEKEKKKKKK